jgi:hypothetical protein
MAGFLYARAGTKPIDAKAIDALGLRYAITGPVQNRETNSKGPNGGPCCLFAEESRQAGKSVGYYPDQQTWRKMPTIEGRPELWIGYWNDAKPTPTDMARRQMLRGASLKLADGNHWQIPIVRRYDDAAQRWESELPALLDFDDAGNVVRGAPVAAYASLWEATAPLADEQFAQDSGESDAKGLDEQQLYRAVVALLQANYVVALPELAMIGALADDESIATIVMVAVRYNALIGWVEDQKKTESQTEKSGTTTTAGVAG